jgi:hypothetical protein
MARIIAYCSVARDKRGFTAETPRRRERQAKSKPEIAEVAEAAEAQVSGASRY